MSQPATTDAEMDTEAMVAELQQKLAKYEQLEQEISKLTQEQATLESYVTNLMASNVRAHKPVNYVEQTFDASDDDSDFEKPSSRPVDSIKLPAKKRGRPGKATLPSVETKAAPAKKKAKMMDSSDDDNDGEAEPPHREGTAETEQVASSPVRHPKGAAEEGHESRSSPVDRRAAVATKRGARAVRDSDSDSDEDFGGGDSDSESDYGDKESDVDTGKGKSKKAAAPAKPKQAAAPRAKAAAKKAAATPAAKKAPPATPARKAVASKVSPAAVRPALKKSSSSQLGSLLQSSARPTSPKAAAATRPLLSSPGSSGSLSLQLSPGSARKTGVRGGSGVSSLKSLLGRSTVPRAGLSRRVQPKK